MKHDWVEVPFESAMLLLRLGWKVQYNSDPGTIWRQPYGIIKNMDHVNDYKAMNARWRARPKETE